MIKITNVDIVKYGQHLFHKFSWQIKSGEHWVITGANGSGKTILLEIISGAITLQGGEVAYDFITGSDWEERYWERKEKIKLIPAHAVQSFLHTHEMYYQQRYYGIGDEDTPRVRSFFTGDEYQFDTLDIPVSLEINKLLNLEITRLSNGQLKKVLLLQSLVKEVPEVLLLDYPFEGLDRESRIDLCNFIDMLADRYAIQIIIVDQHHDLPHIIKHRLILDKFNIVKEEEIVTTHNEHVQQKSKTHLPEAAAEPVVKICNLKIQYGNSIILKNFNWTIHRGERWALTGKNGSGKTTLFSLIFADHPMAYSQEIYLFGKRRGTGESIWDIKNRISYMGPELISYLNPKNVHVTAIEYITGLQKRIDKNKLTGLIAYFQAADFIHQPVKNLSSGQLQLMLIINFFMQEKELLLLDEPFQFLDPANKKLVSAYLQSHVDENTTLVLITHYEEDILHWTKHTMKL